MESTNRFVADTYQWAAKSRFLMFLVGALLYSYVAFIRPMMADSFAYTSLVEWAIVCLVAWRVYRGVRLSIRDRYSAPLELATWEKHTQELEEKTDAKLERLGAIQKEFVEMGHRHGLLVGLVVMLHKNGWSEDRIRQSLLPLIDHRDEKVPWYTFVWDQKSIQSRNENARQQVLNAVINNVTHPHINIPENLEVEA